MAVDRLQGLLSRFSVSARLFHSGPLCGINDFADNGLGQLHLVRRGPLEVHHAGEVVHVTEPSLLFYPRPLAHRFVSDATVGADMACANLAFGGAVSANVGGGATHPIARSLPRFVCLPLAELPGAAPVLEVLFDEAFAQRCGRQIVVDRLFDAVRRAIVAGDRPRLLIIQLMAADSAAFSRFAGTGRPSSRSCAQT